MPPTRSARSTRHIQFRPTLDRLEGRALMAVAGTLDPTFGTGGIYSSGPIDPYNFDGGLSAVAIESDGSIVAAGDIPSPSGSTSGPADKAFGLIGLTPDGALDPSFGTDGEAILPIPGAIGVNLQITSSAGGQFLVGGSFITFDPIKDTTATEEVVARYDANGTLDTTYGTDGLVTLSPSGVPVDGVQFSSVAGHFAVGSDGSVVFTGAVPLAGGATGTQLGVARFTPQGAVDTTFGTDGLVRIDGNLQAGSAVAIQPNGQILVAGVVPIGGFNINFEADIYRLDADGSLDPTLGESGIQAAGFSGISLIQPQSDGTILVEGYFAPGVGGIGTPVDVLLNSDGTLKSRQPTIPGNGAVIDSAALAQHGILISGEAFAPDGSLVAVGYAMDAQNTPTNDVVVRLIQAPSAATPGDYNGDGISDPAVYLPATGTFAIGDSSGRTAGQLVQFGSPGSGASIPAPGDYYGTGQTDIAVYLVNQGFYAIQDPTGATAGKLTPFGTPGVGQTIPAPGDYYNTGQDDVAVYLAASGAFAIQDPTGQTTGAIIPFGMPGVGNSIPVPGDYDGSGHTELAVYVPSTATFYYRSNITGQDVAVPFGAPGLGVSLPMPGDYDGSGKTEVAVYVPSSGTFYYRPAAGGADVAIPFGTPGLGQTIPDPGDYTGSGKTDLGVYLTDTGTLAYRPAGGGNDVLMQFGTPGFGDSIPVTNTVLIPFPGSVSVSGNGFGVQAASEDIPLTSDILDSIAGLHARKRPGQA